MARLRPIWWHVLLLGDQRMQIEAGVTVWPRLQSGRYGYGP